MTRILVVDDEQNVRQTLRVFLLREGWQADGAENGAVALNMLKSDRYEVVLSDIRMPEMDGLTLLSHIRRLDQSIQVIMITAYGSSGDALTAMQQGAYDYITKPFDLDEIKELVNKALEKNKLLNENTQLRQEATTRTSVENIVGKSDAMQKVFTMIGQVSKARTTVLISGESGTGKELIARAIHQMSDRSKRSFVPVNCGAIPSELIESELFGHVRGSFTGATGDKTGLFVEADGGTIFLDEVSELPLDMQVKLLRVLQERTVRPVGSSREMLVDVRVIAATNRNLAEEMRRGRFREDLYFRLNVISLVAPPLRDRRDDIPRLVNHFLDRVCQEAGRHFIVLSPEAMDVLLAYSFPGNVRELYNIIERAVTLSRGHVIHPDSFPPNVLAEVDATAIEESSDRFADDAPSRHQPRGLTPEPADTDAPPPELPSDITQGIDLEDLLEQVERHYLAQALSITGGVKKDAASLLGMSFRSIRYRLQKHHME